eukprot:TRINITY_DN949_c0_g1_i1.p1 TRINITY_DN949_c0_g1~~TRINITY_DN949_c0_g1_i1.p1  ORF type:complete len:209 (-),score=35.76 TRINITY_DN949_c0_g1_i1:207-833(-)
MMEYCYNKPFGCDYFGNRVDRIKHFSSSCSFFRCEKCLFKGKPEELEKHVTMCVGFYVKCKNHDIGCTARMQKDKIHIHENNCEFDPVGLIFRNIQSQIEFLKQQLLKQDDLIKIYKNQQYLDETQFQNEVDELEKKIKKKKEKIKKLNIQISNFINSKDNVKNDKKVNNLYTRPLPPLPIQKNDKIKNDKNKNNEIYDRPLPLPPLP